MKYRYLHSFPTRRSSDLPTKGGGTISVDEGRRARAVILDAALPEGASEEAAQDGRVAIDIDVRSEEHTSELQSPCNLVCRLLLEKKKQEHRTIISPETIT